MALKEETMTQIRMTALAKAVEVSGMAGADEVVGSAEKFAAFLIGGRS